jgi:hypothetical protein
MFPRLLRGAAGPRPFKIDPNKVVVVRSFRADDAAPEETTAEVAEYKPPSLLARHGLLALVFLLACIGGLVLLLRAPHTPAPSPRPAERTDLNPATPIYVEPITPPAPAQPP